MLDSLLTLLFWRKTWEPNNNRKNNRNHSHSRTDRNKIFVTEASKPLSGAIRERPEIF